MCHINWVTTGRTEGTHSPESCTKPKGFWEYGSTQKRSPGSRRSEMAASEPCSVQHWQTSSGCAEFRLKMGWGGVGNLTCSKGRAIKESWTPSHFPSWNCFSPARVTFFHSQWPSEKRTAREKQFLGQGAESQSGKNLSASLFTSLLCFICFLPIYEFHNLILHMDCYCPI